MTDSGRQSQFNAQRSLQKWMTLCSKREYASEEILKKLRSNGAEETEAAKILQQLREQNFQSDLRYARAYVRDKSLISGWGERKITFQLKSKKIPDSVIMEAFKELDLGALDKRKEEVLNRKWNSLSREADREKKREKFLRFGLSRGYEFGYLLDYYNKIKRDK